MRPFITLVLVYFSSLRYLLPIKEDKNELDGQLSHSPTCTDNIKENEFLKFKFFDNGSHMPNMIFSHP